MNVGVLSIPLLNQLCLPWYKSRDAFAQTLVAKNSPTTTKKCNKKCLTFMWAKTGDPNYPGLIFK